MRFVSCLLLWLFFGLTTAARGDVTATELTCEYLVNPLGIDAARPRLSWIVPCDRRGQGQTAYRILVAASADELMRDTGSLWDSGKVESDQATLIEYAGRPLGSRMRCHWKVKLWDRDGREAAWSQPAHWSMGLLKLEDWHGQWIAEHAASGESRPNSTLWLRKTFVLDGQPDRAEAYVASLGYHELYVNGRKVSDAVLSPAVCDYRQRTLYLTYDIAQHLAPGKNCVALWLGRGWAAHQPYGLTQGAIAKAQLEVTLAGGQAVRVATDATWKSHPTPITYLGNWRFNDSGVLGTYFLLKSLTEAERSDLVYPLVNQRTYPGWGYMLDQGATTIWERWNGEESQNHTSFLSVGAWFIEGLAGIRPDPAAPGFKHFFIRPAVVGDLTFVRASYRSIRGPVASQWRIENGRFHLEVEVPAGSTATVYVPTRDRSAVRESGGPTEQADGVRFLRLENGAAVYQIDSGQYAFQTPWPGK